MRTWKGQEGTDCCRVAIAISRMFKLFANVFKFYFFFGP